MALFRLLSVLVALLLTCLVAVQTRYLPTRADDTHMRVVKHILNQLLHQAAGRPSYLAQLRQPEAEEETSAILAMPDDSLYQ